MVTIGVDIANGFSKFTGSTLKGGVLRRQLRLLAEGEPSTNDPKADRAAYAVVGSMSGRAALRKAE